MQIPPGPLVVEDSDDDALLLAVLQSSLDCIVLVDALGRVVEFNPAAEATFGYTRAEALGKPMADLLIPERLRGLHNEHFARYLATGERRTLGRRLEFDALRADGSEVPIELAIAVIRPAPNALFAGFMRDLTKSRHAEESERRFRVAMDNSADMFLLIDRATMRYVDFNSTACRLLGYSREELLARGPQDVLPLSRAELEQSYDALIADPSMRGGINRYYICKDGSHLPFESTRHVLRSGERWLIAAIARDIRERHAIEGTLRESEARFRQTFELAASGMAHVGPDRRFLRVNRKLAAMLGYTEEELVGRPVADFSYPGDLESPAAPGDAASPQWRFLRKDGAPLWASISMALARDAAGEPDYEILVLEDVTERRAQREKIERLTRVHALLSGTNAAIVRIRERNELFLETCRIAVSAGGFAVARVVELDAAGRGRVAAAIDTNPQAFERVVEAYNRDPRGAQGILALAIQTGEAQVSNDAANDPRLPSRKWGGGGSYSLAVLPLKVEGRTTGVIVLRSREAGRFDAEEMKLLGELAGDISFALDHIEKEHRLNYLALYDSLTGLANRTLLVERMESSIQAATQSGAKFALGIIDLERLRTVNESLGRQTGDALIKAVAERFVRAAGKAEVARIGADQFVVMLPAVKGRSEAERMAQAMVRECFGEAFAVEGNELRVAAKAGVAMCPKDGRDAETLLRHAELALRRGKRTGDPLTFFALEMVVRSAGTLTLENKLRKALEAGEFVLHYQPKVGSLSSRITGVEALIRWESAELGLVPPMQFIPLMEETGLILPVGEWALARAVADHRRWVGMGLAAPRVAVNVSAVQLRRNDFSATLEAALAAGAVPMGLDLELTESLIMEDIEGNVRKLKKARDLGASIAIDDFGTGYSSLAYLAKLPVQALKIDRSFVVTMLQDADTMALVQTVISLAHSLRLKVVAEGVDEEAQARVLRLLRCDEMQGFLFAKPLAFEQMTALLEQEQAGVADGSVPGVRRRLS